MGRGGLVAFFLACLTSHLWPQAKARHIAHSGPHRRLPTGTCTSAFPTTLQPMCNQTDQCQGSCCFYAGYCTDSNNNNCLEESPLFPSTQGSKASTHSDKSDGCICDQSITSVTSPVTGSVTLRQSCDQFSLSGQNKCWGVVTCDDNASSPCNKGLSCTVSIAFCFTTGHVFTDVALIWLFIVSVPNRARIWLLVTSVGTTVTAATSSIVAPVMCVHDVSLGGPGRNMITTCELL